MRSIALVPLVSLTLLAACYKPDPRVSAAQDFQQTAFALIADDETMTKKLASLTTGMTDAEVVKAVGPPTGREGGTTAFEKKLENWTYSGQLKTLAILVFENQKLVEVNVY